MRLVLACMLCTVLAAPARAGTAADDEERARGHYEIGLGLYRLGDYRGALNEFAAGYELARKPGFLLNLGQTYRKLGELREARDMYRQFLAAVSSDDPARPEARKVLAEIEQAIRTQPPPEPPRATPPPSPSAAPSPRAASSAPAAHSAPAAPSPPVVGPAPPVVGPAPPDAAPAAAATVSAQPPARRRPRRGLRIGGIVVTVAGVGLLGGGIGAAVAADGLARDLNATDRAGGVFDPSQARAYATDRALATGLFVGGAVLAAGGVVLLAVSAR